MDSKSKQQINREYIDEKVDPIVEKMIVELLKKKPEDSVEYMIKWLSNEGRKLFQEIVKKKKVDKPGHKETYGESSEEEAEQDQVDEEEFQKQTKIKSEKGSRTSVSAEVYGQFNKKENYKPKIIPKNQDQINRLEQRLNESFMFNTLELADLKIVIDAFEEKIFQQGDTVIKEGDDGDNLYVIDQGELDCYKKIDKNSEPKHIKVYEPGQSFGELALLYNAPRAATIIAKTNSVTFALDRECFNNIVKDAAQKKREKYEDFLSKVELLQSMDIYERSKISEALIPLKFQKGDYVVKEGDKGDVFFFVEQGEAIATKTNKETNNQDIVYHYKTGDYFGEISLLKDSPRAANIIAQGELSVVQLHRNAFKRLLGPLEDLLNRNYARYEKYLS